MGWIEAVKCPLKNIHTTQILNQFVSQVHFKKYFDLMKNQKQLHFEKGIQWLI